MNSSWLKVVVGVVVIFFVVFWVLNRGSQSDEENIKKDQHPKTFQQVVREDDERLRDEPNQEQKSQIEEEKSDKVELKELTEEEQIEAERLFEMALAQRKMGRLIGMSYKQMVDLCRQIIGKFPDSSYAFKAKRMMADIPPSERKKYNITDEEIKPYY